MRKMILSAFLAVIAAMPNDLAFANENYSYNFQAYGLGYGQSCRDFVEISSDPTVGRYAFSAWIQGFLSGVQLGASKSAAVKKPSTDSIEPLMKMLTAYCSEHPQVPFLNAVLLGIYFDPSRGK